MWRILMGFAVVLLVCGGGGFGCATKQSQKKAEGYYQEGVALLKTDAQRAFVSFQKAIKENNQHRDAHYLLGHLYAKQGKFKEAVEQLEKVIHIDPDYSEAHTYLGQILVHQGRWQEGIDAYQKALSNPLYGTPDLARFHLGRAYAMQGNMEEAIKAYEEARLVSPSTVEPALVYLELGRAYYKIGKDSKARDILMRVAEVDQEGTYSEEAGQLLGRLRP